MSTAPAVKSTYVPPVSRYMSIWNELKAKKYCRMAAPPVLHARIIKAVQKRRDKDIAYRFELNERHEKIRMAFSSKGNILEIRMIVSTATRLLSGINLGEL